MIVEPGAFIIIKDSRNSSIKSSGATLIDMADAISAFDGTDWDFQPDRLAFVDGRWLIRQNASAIILSGGKSTRIGLDKSMLVYRDKPLIAHIAEQLVPMFQSAIISTNEPTKYEFLGLPMIPDLQPGLGPLMGIASALSCSGSELCFVMGCDIPTVNFRLVNRMLRQAEGYDIVMPRSADGRFEPLFAIYRRSVCRPALEILEAGGRRIVELFDKVRVAFMDFHAGDWYKNINTMDDYLTISKETQHTINT
ncbi:MAG: molybdenum cofactor guanylyltransferase [Spirochaetales bacterium]|nr:MAG: molybdenum cofactor guanylyltransferase [Spirochaetales bacterium]